MRMHFCSRHVRYIVIILEEGNLPHPRCSRYPVHAGCINASASLSVSLTFLGSPLQGSSAALPWSGRPSDMSVGRLPWPRRPSSNVPPLHVHAVSSDGMPDIPPPSPSCIPCTLPAHLLSVRRFRLCSYCLARSADHADRLPNVCTQVHLL